MVFEFEEPLRPLMTIKSRNDDATVVDTSTGHGVHIPTPL